MAPTRGGPVDRALELAEALLVELAAAKPAARNRPRVVTARVAAGVVARSLRAIAPWDPAPPVTTPPAPSGGPGVPFSLVTANFWRENKHDAADAALLGRTRVHLIGLNEGRQNLDDFAQIPGYRLCVDGTGFLTQNPILLREDVHYLGVESRKMCDAVGPSPARSATICYFELGGIRRAHVQTHVNSHIQEGPNNPHELPRVKEAIRHLIRLERLDRELRAAGYRVTHAGDFNWSWSAGDARDWRYSPEVVFRRLGLVTQFDHRTAPAGGTLGKRRIDYIAYDPDELQIVQQSLVGGEHSDHRWPRVDAITLPEGSS